MKQLWREILFFILTGVITLGGLKKTNPGNVVLYKNDELSVLGVTLSKTFRLLHRKITSNKNQSFDMMPAYIAFIPIIVCFFQKTSRKSMHKDLKKYLKTKDCLPAKYNELFNASIRYLLKYGVLVTEFDVDKKEEVLSLSPKGYNETYALVMRSSSFNKTMLRDRIRCIILKKQLKS